VTSVFPQRLFLPASEALDLYPWVFPLLFFSTPLFFLGRLTKVNRSVGCQIILLLAWKKKIVLGN